MPSYQNHQSPKKAEMIGLKIEASDKEALIKICQSEDRPLGYVARELMLRGLADYRRDGQLKDSEVRGKLPLVSARTEEKPKSKVVRK